MKCSARFFLFIRCTERKDNTSNTRKAHMNNDPAPVAQRNYTIPRRERGCWKIENKSALYFYTLYYRIYACAQPSCATFLVLSFSLSALGGNYYIIGGATHSLRYLDDQELHSKCERGKQRALFAGARELETCFSGLMQRFSSKAGWNNSEAVWRQQNIHQITKIVTRQRYYIVNLRQRRRQLDEVAPSFCSFISHMMSVTPARIEGRRRCSGVSHVAQLCFAHITFTKICMSCFFFKCSILNH